MLSAFQNDPKAKEHCLNRMRAHREAGRILQREPNWQKGVSQQSLTTIGSTVNGYDDYFTEERQLMGIPYMLALLADHIQDFLPRQIEKELKWAEAFIEAISVGASDAALMGCTVQCIKDLRDDPNYGVIHLASTRKQTITHSDSAVVYANMAVRTAEWALQAPTTSRYPWDTVQRIYPAINYAAGGPFHLDYDMRNASYVWLANQLLECLRAA